MRFDVRLPLSRDVTLRRLISVIETLLRGLAKLNRRGWRRRRWWWRWMSASSQTEHQHKRCERPPFLHFCKPRIALDVLPSMPRNTNTVLPTVLRGPRHRSRSLSSRIRSFGASERPQCGQVTPGLILSHKLSLHHLRIDTSPLARKEILCLHVSSSARHFRFPK
jgi:hypothetical protein